MATKIRLQRHGKKGKAFFHIVAADSRAPRDGRYIEKLGTYNPNTDPATIEMNFDRTLHWVQVGAEMTDTARALLSYKGILHKNHLLNGVKKGALTAEQVEERFAKWVEEKEGKIQGKKDTLTSADEKDKADRMKAEVALNESRAAEIALKNTPEPEPEPVVEETPVVEATEEAAPATEEATPEAPAAEETPEA
ncbi:MAG: 30S ribosomal protein S16 [Fluviicola sp.]|nr:MAG: 30S ribosomal protein S16 [Fluviicola sp.]